MSRPRRRGRNSAARWRGGSARRRGGGPGRRGGSGGGGGWAASVRRRCRPLSMMHLRSRPVRSATDIVVLLTDGGGGRYQPRWRSLSWRLREQRRRGAPSSFLSVLSHQYVSFWILEFGGDRPVYGGRWTCVIIILIPGGGAGGTIKRARICKVQQLHLPSPNERETTSVSRA